MREMSGPSPPPRKLASLMESTVEPVEGNKVKLSITVPGADFEREVDAAFKRIAREVRIPGFRPGKAPRKLLEARIGTEAARGDALEQAVPQYYADAITEHDVDVIAAPEIDITSGQEDGDVTFDAVVEVRPVVTVGGYDSLRVIIESPTVSDEEIEERVDRLRRTNSTLEAVERASQEGDQLTVDIAGSQDGEALPELTADDYLYEVGSGSIVPEFDEHLTGVKVADIVEFAADHPDPEQDQVSFRVLVKEIQQPVLPDADDEFAQQASEFETIEELRADLGKRMSSVRKIQARMQLSEKAAEALAELVDEEIPEALVSSEMQQRIEELAMRLQAQGIGFDQYFASTGQDQESWVAGLREVAERAAKVDLALRAVGVAEDIEVTDEDLDAEFATVAERVGQKPAAVRTRIERNGQMSAVRSDIRKRKALDWLIERVELVDGSGKTIDRAELELEPDPGASDPDEDPTEDDE